MPLLRRLSYEQYGINVKSLEVIQSSFIEDQYLTDILAAHQVAPGQIEEIARKSESIFDVRHMRAGHAFTILKSPDQRVAYFIYEINGADYVVFDLRDSVRVYQGSRPVVTRRRTAAGRLRGTLFETVEASDIDLRLAKLMEDAFASSVDFLHLGEQDYFKAVYEEQFVDEASIGVTRLLAASFSHRGETYTAIGFGPDSAWNYFDPEGHSLRRTFLKSPVASSPDRPFSALSLGRGRQGFRGIQYALPAGMPVLAVGEGTVAHMQYHPRQGHEVIVRHSAVFSSQYLYLGKVQGELAPGSRLSQGDQIGTTGAPDARSAPRLLYKLWERGRSVNPEKVSAGPVARILPEEQEAFGRRSREMQALLDRISSSEARQMASGPTLPAQPAL
jgi:murein DD-endopeptidase MepM/ murein hydrolase activator NlpD